MARYNKGRFILLFLLLILTGCSLSPKGTVVSRQESPSAKEAGEAQGEEEGEESTASGEERILVHVCGEVNNPGVYEFSPGSRVIDAVEAAGGFTGKADEESLNLAEELSDASRIRVLALGEAGETAEDGEDWQADGGKVDLNTATLEELMTLPGIGEKRAEAILKLREEKGSFQKTEDLLEAEGIKEGIFRKIKDLIKV